MARTAKTVTVSLPPELAKKAERLARREGQTRSEFFRAALRQHIQRIERWDQLTAIARERVRELGIKEEDVPRLVKEWRRERRANG